jgi:hypothetical protein
VGRGVFALRGIGNNPRQFATSFYARFDPPGVGFAGASTVAPDGDDLILSSAFSNAVQVLDPATGAIRFDTRSTRDPSPPRRTRSVTATRWLPHNSASHLAPRAW